MVLYGLIWLAFLDLALQKLIDCIGTKIRMLGFEVNMDHHGPTSLGRKFLWYWMVLGFPLKSTKEAQTK